MCLCTARVLVAGAGRVAPPASHARVRSRAAQLLLAFAVVASSACGPNGSDAHVGARARPTSSIPAEPSPQPRAARKGKRPDDEPTLDGTRCAAFLPFLPIAFEGYRAKAPAEGKDIELGEGAGLSVLKRGYFKNSTGLEIEIVDTERSKPLRALFEETRELERDNDTAVIKPIRVQGHKAVAQWNSTARAARVSVLVEGRYIVSLSLRPADNIATSVGLADKLELAGLAKLQTGEEIAAH